MSKDYYEILGCAKNATAEEIKRAYRKKAHECHPDKANGNEQKFKEVNEAFQVLGSEEKRHQYDRFGQTFEQAQRNGGAGGFGGAENINFDFQDLGDIFSGFFGGGQARQQRRGSDIQADVEISLVEAVLGTERDFSMMKLCVCEACGGGGARKGSEHKTCSACGGRGTVERLQNVLFGNVRVAQTCDACGGRGKKPVSACGTCSGTGVHRRKDAFTVSIPAGINHGQRVKIAGRGEAATYGAPAGDLYVRVFVNIPKRVSRKARKLLEELRGEL